MATKITLSQTVIHLGVEQQVTKIIRVAPFGFPSGVPASSFTQKGGILVGTGAGAYAEQAPGANGQFVGYDNTSPTGTRPMTPTISINDPTNYLINGGFPFAQRQTPGTLTTIADNKYSADRWRVTRANADVQYARVSGVGVSGLNSQNYGQFKKITNAGKIHIVQILENINTIPMCGQTVVFQAKIWGDAARTIRMATLELQAAGTADTIPATLVTAFGADTVDPTLGANVAVITGAQSKAATTTPQVFSVSVTVPTNSKNLIVAIWSDSAVAANGSIYVAEAGLRFGSQVVSWTPRPVAHELMLCQRYYEKSYDVDIAPGTNTGSGLMTGVGTDANVVPGMVFAVQKRSSAGVSIYSQIGTANKFTVAGGGDDAGTVSVPGLSISRLLSYVSNTSTVAGKYYGYHWTAENEL